MQRRKGAVKVSAESLPALMGLQAECRVQAEVNFLLYPVSPCNAPSSLAQFQCKDAGFSFDVLISHLLSPLRASRAPPPRGEVPASGRPREHQEHGAPAGMFCQGQNSAPALEAPACCPRTDTQPRHTPAGAPEQHVPGS